MTTSVVIGIIAIIVAFALLIVLCFRGMSAMYVAPLCALVVAVACGMPLVDTMVNTFAGGAGGFLQVQGLCHGDDKDEVLPLRPLGHQGLKDLLRGLADELGGGDAVGDLPLFQGDFIGCAGDACGL